MGGREEREDREPTTQSPVTKATSRGAAATCRRRRHRRRRASADCSTYIATARAALPAAGDSKQLAAAATTTNLLLLLRRRGIKRGQQLSTATLATAATQLTRSLQLPAAQPPYARTTANDRTWLYESRCLLCSTREGSFSSRRLHVGAFVFALITQCSGL